MNSCENLNCKSTFFHNFLPPPPKQHFNIDLLHYDSLREASWLMPVWCRRTTFSHHCSKLSSIPSCGAFQLQACSGADGAAALMTPTGWLGCLCSECKTKLKYYMEPVGHKRARLASNMSPITWTHKHSVRDLFTWVAREALLGSLSNPCA